jgi:hypothetical protein
MGVVDSLVHVVDFAVQGAAALFLVWYLLHGIERFDTWFGNCLGYFVRRSDSGKSDTGGKPRSDKGDAEAGPGSGGSGTGKSATKANDARLASEIILLTVLIGGTYALGLVVNNLSYEFLQPVHTSIIGAARRSQRSDVFCWRWAFASITRHVEEPDKKQQALSLCEQVAWDNKRHDAAQTERESLLRQTRVLRGAMTTFLLLALFSVVRLLVALLRRYLRPVKVIPKSDSPATDTRSGRWLSEWLFFPIGLLLYVGCMWAWTSVEAEYHLNVYYGIRTALPDVTTERTIMASSSTTTGRTEGGSSLSEKTTDESTAAASSWALCEDIEEKKASCHPGGQNGQSGGDTPCRKE